MTRPTIRRTRGFSSYSRHLSFKVILTLIVLHFVSDLHVIKDCDSLAIKFSMHRDYNFTIIVLFFVTATYVPCTSIFYDMFKQLVFVLYILDYVEGLHVFVVC